ncbi:MAG: hypothetical protein WD598_16415 [Acidimicrobiia bacterium]
MSIEEPHDDLPPREPRPLGVHVAADAAIAFLVLVVVLLVFSVSIWVILGVAGLLGLLAAPFTRRAEERALARRYATGGGSPSA